MIETRAHKEGKSKELKLACDRLINGLRKEHHQLKNRKAFWIVSVFFIGLMAGLMYLMYSQIAPFEQYVSPMPILATTGVSGLIMAFIMARALELQATEMNEVSSDFYATYVEAARRFPDLVILVEGQGYLTIKDALKSLDRLRCRAHIEMKNDRAIGGDAAKALLDVQRAAFQAISMKDCNNTASSQLAGV